MRLVSRLRPGIRMRIRIRMHGNLRIHMHCNLEIARGGGGEYNGEQKNRAGGAANDCGGPARRKQVTI
jgi:hypothetical protein